MTPEEADPFDDLLNLEDQYYQEGLDLGRADGQKAGRAEGRLFGLEKGFDKFTEMGRMNGQAVVLLGTQPPTDPNDSTLRTNVEQNADLKSLLTKIRNEVFEMGGAPTVKSTERLEKQITSLFDLTDPATLSSLNTEEAIEDFDERRKRAIAKSIMIEKTLDAGKGESQTSRSSEKDQTASSHAIRLKRNGQGTEKNIEDFGQI